MESLRPTVKRNISLFSVQSWQQGYGRFLEESLGWYYPIYFHFDGEKVNFYHTVKDFNYFKRKITPKLIQNEELFDKIGDLFRKNIEELKEVEISKDSLDRIFELIGRIMSLYIFIVSDSFVEKVPRAWDLRLLSEGILYEWDNKLEKYFESVLEDNDADKKLAHVLLYQEIKGLLEHKPLSVKEARSRLNNYILENDKLCFCGSFKEFCQENNLYNPEWEEGKSLDIKKIQGQIAYKGKAVGKVCVVRGLEGISRVDEGDIIVCIMTNVNYTLAISKSCAIVTDEGGITCHAAIVSRELKKPCIIGTKIATKVLKDGDLVEVDAERGTVRIING